MEPLLGGKSIDNSLCELVNEPLVILDVYGNILAHNRGFSEMLGTPSASYSGQNLRDIDLLTELWNSFLYFLNQSSEKKDRLIINNREFELTFHFIDSPRLGIISILFYDVTHFITIEKELLKRNKELMVINTLSGAFISSDEVETVLNDILEKVLMITDFPIGWIVLNEENVFRLRAHKGLSVRLQKGIEEGILNNIIFEVLESKEPLYILEGRDVQSVPLIKQDGIVFVGIVPLRISSSDVGVLFLGSRRERSFEFDLASMMSLVGNQISLILEKVRLFEETKRLSITDALTGLYNARFFYHSLDKEIERARRYSEHFSLVIFDIDDFKEINDTYGHQAGDDILREFARILLGYSRKTDIVARYGGEEFVIILPNTKKKEAFLLSDRIREQVCDYTFTCNGNDVKITISGGIAGFPNDGDDARKLLYAADMALYAAKRAGKKQVIMYDRSIQ